MLSVDQHHGLLWKIKVNCGLQKLALVPSAMILLPFIDDSGPTALIPTHMLTMGFIAILVISFGLPQMGTNIAVTAALRWERGH